MKKIITRNVPIEFFIDGTFETELNDFVTLLEQLEDCDGLINSIYIDKHTASYLEKKKIIRGQGSYALKNNNLRKKLLEEIKETIFEGKVYYSD